MRAWTVIDRPTIDLPSPLDHSHEMWLAMLELSDMHQEIWTLIGGQMVFLHAIEHGVMPPRLSQDLDIVVNIRLDRRGLRDMIHTLTKEMGFEFAGISEWGIAHRYRRGAVIVDVLTPEGLGERADLTTTRPGRTLQTQGGTQALDRTELVPVRTRGRDGTVPRPSLLGAIIIKAVAAARGRRRDVHNLDLALLLTLVNDPTEMASRLTKKDLKRLRARTEMDDPDLPAWGLFDKETAGHGRAAFRVLTGG